MPHLMARETLVGCPWQAHDGADVSSNPAAASIGQHPLDHPHALAGGIGAGFCRHTGMDDI